MSNEQPDDMTENPLDELTVKDLFTAAALAGLLAGKHIVDPGVGERAIDAAELVMAERAKRQQPQPTEAK